jgi:undecaprenyl-diphosphatase
VNSIDHLIYMINGLSNKYWSFDRLVVIISWNSLFKGGVIIAIYWYLWFFQNGNENIIIRRKTILASFIGTVAGIMITLALGEVLPFRIRPLHNLNLHLYVTDEYRYLLKEHNSFPSDTATFVGGLVTGVFLVSRKIGLFAISYAIVFVLFPRVFLGLHYPTDIIAGLFIGIIAVLLANIDQVKNYLTSRLLEWSEKNPQAFYGLSFILTYEMASLFEHIRPLGNYLLMIIEKISNRII